jgi:hypothetical protein
VILGGKIIGPSSDESSDSNGSSSSSSSSSALDLVKGYSDVATAVKLVEAAKLVASTKQRLGNTYKHNHNKATCAKAPWPVHVEEVFEREVADSEITQNYPDVLFLGPCLLDTFKRAAGTFKGMASNWRFMKTPASKHHPEVQVRHRGEEPRSLIQGPKGPSDQDIESFMIDAGTPLVGKLDPGTIFRYGDFSASGSIELVLGFFSPDTADIDILDSPHRLLLKNVAEALRDENGLRSHHVAFIDVRAHGAWVASEFRITSFPAIAVFRKFPGLPQVLHGQLQFDAVMQFIRDVDDGCVGHTKSWDSAARLFTGRSADNSVCDSLPVL